MASKMADIQRQLERTTGRQKIERIPAKTPESITPRPTPTKAPSREGKIHIGAYLHPDFKTSLRLVQARKGHPGIARRRFERIVPCAQCTGSG
jgi:hypothetical protein